MNKPDIRDLLQRQDELNTLIHAEWKDVRDRHDFVRAMVVEVGELIEWTGFKWWSAIKVYEEQAQIEIIDLWFFFISLAILEENYYDGVNFVDDLEAYVCLSDMEKEELEFDKRAVQKLSIVFVNEISKVDISILSVMKALVKLTEAAGITSTDLQKLYTAKLILNIFRQEHGYSTGRYVKFWEPKHMDHAVEDNTVLEHIMKTTTDPDEIKRKLEEAYKTTI